MTGVTALVDPAPDPSYRRLAWLASGAEGAPLGTAFLRLFTGSGQRHLGELTLHVHPVERRRGVGSVLLEAAVRAARRDGRRVVLTQAEAGSPGAAFAATRGFHRVLSLMVSRLPLATADLAAIGRIADQPHSGYRLVDWTGTVPPELAGAFVTSRHAMDDMPTGGADFGVVSWDLERVRSAAAAVARRGDLLYTVAAVCEADGAIAGFSELVVPGIGTGDGQHYGTAVLPDHRGRGLGRWMKASAILRVRRRHPALAGLLTDTACSNVAMRRVNEVLGYLPSHVTHEYQLAI